MTTVWHKAYVPTFAVPYHSFACLGCVCVYLYGRALLSGLRNRIYMPVEDKTAKIGTVG
jgi:hypothetical protein